MRSEAAKRSRRKSEQRRRKTIKGHVWSKISLLRRCARKKGITYTNETIATVRSYLFDNIPSHCPFTGEPLTKGENLHLDHIIPVSRGGEWISLDNLRWVSETYNRAKFDMTAEEFAHRYTLTYNL
jgi:5-methylcytosine-specific restriction endonuclease McrA